MISPFTRCSSPCTPGFLNSQENIIMCVSESENACAQRATPYNSNWDTFVIRIYHNWRYVKVATLLRIISQTSFHELLIRSVSDSIWKEIILRPESTEYEYVSSILSYFLAYYIFRSVSTKVLLYREISAMQTRN